MQKDMVSRSFALDNVTTALLLGNSNQTLSTRPRELMMGAILHSFGQTFADRPLPPLFTEGHGREAWSQEIDVSETVGWFTTIFPIQLDKSRSKIDMFRRVKDIHRQIPQKGWAYFTSRYFNAEGIRAFAGHENIEISFDYLGMYQQLERSDALMKQMPLEPGTYHSSDMADGALRIALIEITASMNNGELFFAVDYNRHMRHQGRIIEWAQAIYTSLCETASEFATLGTELTLSDVPMLQLNYAELESLSCRLEPILKQSGCSFENIEAVYPCTPMQEGILVGMAKDQKHYNVQWIIEISDGSSSVEFERLQKAWQAVMDRHPMLRTTFLEAVHEHNLFYQVVMKEIKSSITRIGHGDLTSLESMIAPEQGENGASLTMTYCESTSGTALLRLDASHAILDGSTMPLLMEDIKAAYDGRLSSEPGPKYCDFISYLQTRPAEDDMMYWLKHLENITPCEFPLLNEGNDLPRLGNVDVLLPESQIRLFCTLYGCTLSNLIHLVWAVVLWRYSGVEDVCFGYLVSGRDAPIQGASEMIGPLINMMICRLRLDNSSSMLNLLEQVQTDFARSFRHQHVSLGKMQQKLGLRGRALFNSTVNVQRLSYLDGKDSNVSLREVGGRDPSEYSLSLNVDDRGRTQRLKASISYWTSWISDGQATSLASVVIQIVESLIADPHQTIGELEVLGEAHKLQIERWNSPTPQIFNECVYDQFTHQADLQPNSIAVQSPTSSLIYRMLDTLSSNLADFLVSNADVQVGKLVPVCVHQTPHAIAVLLGILKAGGVCFPLEPTKTHLVHGSLATFMEAGLVIIQPEYRSIFDELATNEGNPINVIELPDELCGMLPDKEKTTHTAIDPSNTAFVISTSGTASEPDRVALQHCSLATSFHYRGLLEKSTSSTRTFHTGVNLSNSSIMDILTTLSFGGCVCLSGGYESITDLPGSIQSLEANCLRVTPAIASQINPADLPGVQTLVLVGEPLSSQLVKKWTAAKIRVVVTYGQAECSFLSAGGVAVHSNICEGSIGKAVGAKLWVVEPDNHHKLVPIGCQGELLIEGPLLGRGYPDTDKDASAFITDPAWSIERMNGNVGQTIKSRRFFKSGDLVRQHSDGSLLFIGSKNMRLEIKGQAVDIGETERSLTNHDNLIRHAVAVSPQSGFWSGKLVAVFSLKDLSNLAELRRDPGLLVMLEMENKDIVMECIIQLRLSLESELPDHKIPSVWVPVHAIPLDSSDKLCRRRVIAWLEKLDAVTCNRVIELCCRDELVQPKNDMELRLQRVWARVLSLQFDQVGLKQSFTSLGGDSISAMQIISRCKMEGILVTIQDIMRCKTITQLAPHAKAVESLATSIQLEEAGLGSPFQLSPIQKMFFSVFPNGQNYYNQSFLLRFTRKVSEVAVAQGMKEIVQKHPMLRARFLRKEGSWQQITAPNSENSFKFTASSLPHLDEASSLFAGSHAAIDIEQGPVFAVNLVTLPDNNLYIFMAAHHLVIDLVSWRVICDDLEAFLEGRPIVGEPFSFMSWSRLLLVSANRPLSPGKIMPSQALPANLGYWGMSNGSNLSQDARVQSFRLSLGTTKLLLGDANKSFRTDPVELMLAATIHSFGQVFTDRTLPAVFSEGHGREADSGVDLSRTVGWFTIMSPIQIHDFEVSNFMQTIATVKDTRRRIPNKGCDYFNFRYNHPEGAVTLHKDERMEIMFNYHGLYQQLEGKDALFSESVDAKLPPDVALTTERFALFEINASVSNGELTISMEFSEKSLHQVRIRAWIQGLQTVLEDHLPQLALEARQYTLLDFPMLSIDYAGLHKLLYEELLVQQPDAIEDIYPCSSVQEGILISRMKHEGHYDVEWIGEFKPSTAIGSIDIDQLSRAWQAVVNRHQILRTIFVEDVTGRGLFLQVVLSDVRARIAIVGENSFAEPVQRNSGSDQASLSARLSHSVTMCETAQGSVKFKLQISHAILDGTTTSIFVRELNLAYRNLLPPGPAPLYSDFISGLSELPDDENLAYWSECLDGARPCHFPKLVGEDDDTPLQHGETVLTLEHSEELHRFCDNHGLTLANLFQGVWARTLQVYTGMEDVSFGCLSSGRDISIDGIEAVAGPSINIMVCRPWLKEQETVLQNLLQIQIQWMNSMPHQHTSLAKIHHKLQLGGNKLFNSMLNIQRKESNTEQNEAILVETISDYDPSEYDISLDIEDSFDHLTLILSFWSSRINENHPKNILTTVLALTDNFTHYSDNLLRDIELCSDAHKLQMDRWNLTSPVLVESCVHQIIKEQSIAGPDRQAVHSHERSFTFEELDAFSTRLAHHLILLGAGSGIIVPFCFDKSPWAIVTMLAIFKAGSAYVALDPTFPEQRRQVILDIVNANIVVCQRQHALLFAGSIDHVVVVDENAILELHDNRDNILCNVSPSHPAIFQFTSGSTGKPKGIVLEHRNICTSMYHNGNLNLVNPTTRSLRFASYTFDISTNEIWGVLGRGGCVCVPSEKERKNDLSGAINRLGVNWLDIPPAVVSIVDPLEVPQVETIVLGGEAISKDIVNKWVHYAKIIASYGPAEASVACGGCQIMSSRNVAGILGVPSGSRLWVVDPNNYNVLMPIGCRGELLIEGPLVAREYLKEPEKTKKSFVQDPAWSQDRKDADFHSLPRRMYRSGDLARFETDGTMTYLGRLDDQVKLHGYRIELGDVEHHILNSNIAKHATVTIPQAGPWKQRLTAVLSLEILSPLYDSERVLRKVDDTNKALVAQCIKDVNNHLASEVPQYMVPSHYIVLEDLPLNASGKIDRRRVSEWLCGMDNSMYQKMMALYESEDGLESCERPMSEMERCLRDIWGEVLDLPSGSIGLEKSFIALGGDSVSAMQILGKCKTKFIETTIQDVFISRTISQLAPKCRFKIGHHSITHGAKESVATFDVTPAQEAYLRAYPGSEHPQVQSKLLKLTQSQESRSVRTAIQNLMKMHPVLSTQFEKLSGHWKQRISLSNLNAYWFGASKLASLSEATKSIEDLWSKLDLNKGISFAAHFLDLTDGSQFIYMIAHKAVVDSESWQILLVNFDRLLTGDIPAPKRDTNFIAWIERNAQQPAQLTKSLETLWESNIESSHGFKTDADRQVSQFSLDKETTSLLLGQAGNSMRTSPSEIVAACLLQSFRSVFIGQPPPRFFIEESGRKGDGQEIDVSAAVGCFTSLSYAHVDFSTLEQDSIIGILRQVKDSRWQPLLNLELQDSKGMTIVLRYMESEASTKNQYTSIDQATEYLSLPFARSDNSLLDPASLSISTTISNGQLSALMYSTQSNTHEMEIAIWARLCELICTRSISQLAVMDRTFTQSDFPHIDLTPTTLKHFTESQLPALGLQAADVEDLLSCSPMQQGMLYSHAKESSYYNNEWLEEVINTGSSEPVDPVRLEKTWQYLVQRHQILRTAFIEHPSQDGSFAQIVLKRFSPLIKRVKCDSLTEFEVFGKPVNHHFGSPPHCLTICEAKENRIFLRIEISHAITDGISKSLLLRELADVYGGKSLASRGPLYSGFIAHLRSQLQADSITYWTNLLQDLQPCAFPTFTSERADARATRDLKIHVASSSDLRNFCTQYEVTLSHVFQAAWAVLLRQYVGTDDICFGYLASGRDLPLKDVDHIVGPLINMLISRVQLDPLRPLLSCINQMRDGNAEHTAHQHASMAQIYNKLDLGSKKPFNTVITLRRDQDSRYRDSKSLEVVDLAGRGATEYDLVLDVLNSDMNVDVTLTYAIDTLSEAHAVNIAEALGEAITAMLQNPDRPLQDVNLVGSKQRDQLENFHRNSPLELEECVHDRINRQVERNPLATAICSATGDFTYGELDELSTRLASHLLSIGVQPDNVVGVHMEKSPYAIVAMIAIWKAGGTFLPLDPSYPHKRIRQILEARLAIEALDARNLHACPPSHSKRTAYVLYTSGSTGEPKGVMVPHAAICSSMAAHAQVMNISSSTRCLQFASYTFDAAICEIFTTLQAGGCVCVPTDQAKMNNIAFEMERMRVNWAFFTPTVIRLIEPSQVPSLRTLVLGGEAVKEDNIRTWEGKVNLLNGYGPTETCVFAVCGIASLDLPAGKVGHSMGSIGWVVDPMDHDKLMPIGSSGELLIEGPIVAAGYLNDARQTNAAFIDSPEWSQRRGAVDSAGISRRFYKTGDLVRQDVDGSFIMLGRKDLQQKINGQRMELGEVEQQIHLHIPSLQVCVEYLSLQDSPRKLLIAALICSSENYSRAEGECAQLLAKGASAEFALHVKKLKEALPASLPSYMVPSAYVALNWMPLTISGKTDRRAIKDSISKLRLTYLQQDKKQTSQQYGASTMMNGQLVKLWAETLNTTAEEFTADSNFFSLGGDSIAAMKLVSLARTHEISLTVSDIFKHPVLKSMSLIVDSNVGSHQTEISPFSILSSDTPVPTLVEEASRVCKVETAMIEDIYPCTSLQEGMTALSVSRPGSYVNRYIEKIPSDVEITRLCKAWQNVYTSCPILRTRIFQHKISGSLQVVIKGGISWTQSRNLDRYLGEDRSVVMECGDPFIRFGVIETRAPSDNRYLVITAHHALYDAWSMQLIFEQVEKLYRGDKVEALMPFNSFLKYLTTNDVCASKQFWTEQLIEAKSLPWPALPGGYQPLCDADIAIDIQFKRRKGSEITSSTVMRAAWSIVLANYANTDDVIFGVTLTGRSAPIHRISHIAGPTISTIPLRIKLEQDSIYSFLRKLQDQATSMIPHEQTGLQEIRRFSSTSEAACDFKTLFVVQPAQNNSNRLTEAIELTGGFQGSLTYALTVICELSHSGAKLRAVFDSECIHSQQAQRMLHQMEHVIQELCSESRTKQVSSVNMLGIAEKKLLLRWNKEVPVIPKDLILDQVDQRSRARPTAHAIHAWDGLMTYGELDIVVSQLAAYLRSNEIGIGDTVLLCFEKSKWYVAAILATLRSGAAFAPIDPTHPAEQLQHIVEDTRAKRILASTSLAHRCRQLIPRTTTELAVVEVNPELVDGLHTEGHNRSGIHHHTPAYIMFTSGSTGTPKGVIIEHGSLAVGLREQCRALHMLPSTRILQFASHTFDLSVLEILGTLTTGGCICIPADLERLDHVDNFITKARVNYAILTPSVARTVSPMDVPGLKTLVLGGEGWGKELVDKWGGSVRIHNAYGPTEATILSNAADVSIDNYRQNNIGRGVGVATWICDPNDYHILTPVGCIGELLLEGPALARGYLNNDLKTRKAFVYGPSWATEIWNEDTRPPRFYRTGDLVRYESDGTVTFLGRKDSQVKVNGQRLELSEVEHHIIGHPFIRNALVLFPKIGVLASQLVVVAALSDLPSTPDGDSDVASNLTAVPKANWESAVSKYKRVKDDISTKLAAYKIPTIWLLIKDFPLQSSGKLARKLVDNLVTRLLPEELEEFSAFAGREEFSLPVTDTETAMRAIWSEVLNKPECDISTNASFTSLGGDSISAMLVVAGCRSRKITISVRDVLEQRAITRLGACAQIASVYPSNRIWEAQADSCFPLTPVQGLFFSLAPYGENNFNQSFALRVNRLISESDLTDAIHKIIQRHSILRARFQSESGIWSQKISSDIKASVHVGIHQSLDESQRSLLLQQSHTSLDIKNGPLMAVEYIKSDNSPSTLLLIIHHLVVDLVSWRIILRDIECLVTTGAFGGHESLSFPIWSHILEEKMAGSQTGRSASLSKSAFSSYWGMEGIRNTYKDANTLKFSIEEADTAALMGDANRAYRTEPVELFIGSLLYSFSKEFNDRPHATVFNESHGREPWDRETDITRTVGWFTTMMPIAAELHDSPSLFETIKRAKDAKRLHADNGLEHFYTELRASDTAQTHEIEILFNYSGLFQQLERAESLFSICGDLDTSKYNINPEMQRFALFDGSVSFSNAKLDFCITSNRRMQRTHRIERWVKSFASTLRRVAHELPKQCLEPTVSDYKLLRNVGNDQLRKFSTVVLPSLGINSEQIEDIIPCVPAQQTMLQKQQDGNLRFYSVQTLWELKTAAGSVHIGRLKKAWQLVVARSESLRCIFTDKLSTNGDFHQILLKEVAVGFSAFDAVSEELARESLESLNPVSASVPYNLAVCIVGHSQQTYCRLNISHATIDHRSMTNLLGDIQKAYDGLLGNDSGPSLKNFVSYAMSAQNEHSRRYWQQYLANARPLSFPVESQDSFGSLHTTKMTIADPDRLHAFCDETGITLFNLLQASWATLLQRYTRSEEVQYGYMVSARDAPVEGAQEMIGLLVNISVCRVKVDADNSPKRLTERMKTDFAQSIGHAYGAASEIAAFERSHNVPLFDTLINYRGGRKPTAKDEEVTRHALTFHMMAAEDPMHYKIVVTIEDEAPGLSLSLTYWQPTITESYTNRIAKDLGTILLDIVNDTTSG
ncbi:MAG: hypothetical protein Q9195_004496 [Heterodermia aff. obscurata]